MLNFKSGRRLAIKLKSPIYFYLFHGYRWAIIIIPVGFFIGTASALFLTLLEKVTTLRVENDFLIFLLPAIGLLIGFLYSRFGKDIQAGNSLILKNIIRPGTIISYRMAPMILLTTLLTHMVGGSAGREGTAIQMAGSIADQVTKPFRLSRKSRKKLLMASIAGGFASIFGTPLAGIIFSMELPKRGSLTGLSFFQSIAMSFIAHLTTIKIWQVGHTNFIITEFPEFSFDVFCQIVLAGMIFGITAYLFIFLNEKLKHWSNQIIQNDLMRPFLGGFVLLMLFLIFDLVFMDNSYQGLGIPTILESFEKPKEPYVFLLKILFTTLTLGVGFRGGEVTPLFFIGATLGSALSAFLPLSTSLLAGLGFVSVFAGATNTPIACFVLGLELFGLKGALYFLIACFISAVFSGEKSIYSTKF